MGASDRLDATQKQSNKMHSLVTRSMQTATEAHKSAMEGESELAKYNSSVLRTLEKAFATDPEADIPSKLPSNYSAAVAGLRLAAQDWHGGTFA